MMDEWREIRGEIYNSSWLKQQIVAIAGTTSVEKIYGFMSVSVYKSENLNLSLSLY